MGVTIHFDGLTEDLSSQGEILRAIEAFAHAQGWPMKIIDSPFVKLKRVIAEENVDYEGPVSGVELQPHANTEPLRFEFDSSYFLQDYCKTQFAPLGVHVQIVELLRSIQPLFQKLDVYDEGEFFETGDSTVLQKHVEACFAKMDELLTERSDLTGPVRLENGRIVDLTSDA